MIDHRGYTHNLSSCEIKAWVYYELTKWPGGLIAPSVEHCPGIAEVMFRPEFFSGFNFTTAYVVRVTAMINHKIHIFLRNLNIWSFIYSFASNNNYDSMHVLFAPHRFSSRKSPTCFIDGWSKLSSPLWVFSRCSPWFSLVGGKMCWQKALVVGRI